jgi:hypothetical protein
MTKTKTNPMASMVETVKKTSAGATVKTVSAKPTLTPTQVLDFITASASACSVGEKAKAQGETALKTFNTSALSLHNSGVRLLDGRKKDATTMASRKAFLDQCEKDGLASKTAQNYYELFFKTVNSGKELKTFHFQKDAKKSKTEKDSTPEPLANLLVAVYNHADFEKSFSVDAQNEIIEILKKGKCI